MSTDVVQTIVVFIHGNASVTKYVAFAVALFGSLPGTNFIIPSGTILNALGVLIGAGVASWFDILWATGGAIAGMSLSYTFGRHFELKVRHIPLLQRRKSIVNRAEELFRRHSTMSILVGYFSGPLRAPVAIAAGIASLPRRKFEFTSCFAGLLWASISICIGALPGSMIDADGPWIILMPIAVPTAIVIISSVFVFVQKYIRRAVS